MSEQDERGGPAGQQGPDLSSGWAHGPYAAPTGPATWVPPLVQRKRRSNRPLLVAGVAVVALLLVVGGLFLFRGDPLTFDGRTVADPEGVLTEADDALAAYAEGRNGATGDDSRCWFELTDADRDAVRDALVCGPVLFVDGEADRSWLRFPVTAEADGEDVRLTVATEPTDPEPGTRPAGDLLHRPDGGTPPEGSGGLEAPAPPEAEAGWSASGPFEDVSWNAPEVPARLSGPGAAVVITGLAQPERVGSGDDARRAADGDRLIAVQYAVGGGEGLSTAAPRITYEVSGADPVPVEPSLLTPGSTVEAALSVPEDAEAADLVVDDAGIVQRLSLLTGEPAAGNIQVVTRDNRRFDLNASQQLPGTVSSPTVPPTPNVPFTITVADGALVWFGGPDGSKRPDPARAWLVVDVTMVAPNSAPSAVLPALLSLRLPDGAVVPAVDLNDDPGLGLIAFDVPATFSAGVLAVTGIGTFPDGVVVDFGPGRVEFPVAIPAG